MPPIFQALSAGLSHRSLSDPHVRGQMFGGGMALTNDARAEETKSPCLEGLLTSCSSPSARRTTAKLRGHVCVFHTNKPSDYLASFSPFFSFLTSKFVLFYVLYDYILSILEQNE